MKRILSEVYTEQDHSIAENLKEVEKLLLAYFREERTLHFDWNGYVSELKFDDWDTLGPEKKAFDEKRTEILEKLQAGAIDEDEDLFLECFSDEEDQKSFFELVYRKVEDFEIPIDLLNLKVPVPVDFSSEAFKISIEKGFDDNLFDFFYFWASSMGKEIAKKHSLLSKISQQVLHLHQLSKEKIVSGFDEKFSLDNLFIFFKEEPETLSLILTKYHFFQNSAWYKKDHISSFEKAVSEFSKILTHLPIEYVGGRNKYSPDLGTAVVRMLSTEDIPSLETAADYHKSDAPLIINGLSYFRVKLVLSLLCTHFPNRLGNYEPIDNPFFPFQLQDPALMIVQDLMSIIQFKMEALLLNFEKLLTETRKNLDIKGLFKEDIGFAKYASRYYLDLFTESSSLYLPVLHKIKLPDNINNLIGNSIVELVNKHIDKLKGEPKLLLPSQMEAITFAPSLQKRLTALFEESEKPKNSDLFTKEKIYWPEEKKPDLEYYFGQLYQQMNVSGDPYVSIDAVHYLLHANFSCYKSILRPVLLDFAGPKNTLTYFIYKVYEYQGNVGNQKPRFTQFLLQNFKLFHNPDLGKKSFDNLTKNIKNIKPQGEVIRINKYKATDQTDSNK